MSTQTTLPRLLKAEEVATATNVPKATVYELGRTGQLPCVRIGRAMRFSEVVVADWIARGGTGGAEAGS
jgi:excisionase family DNA binding protein